MRGGVALYSCKSGAGSRIKPPHRVIVQRADLDRSNTAFLAEAGAELGSRGIEGHLNFLMRCPQGVARGSAI